jgi:hypothetical protein
VNAFLCGRVRFDHIKRKCKHACIFQNVLSVLTPSWKLPRPSDEHKAKRRGAMRWLGLVQDEGHRHPDLRVLTEHAAPNYTTIRHTVKDSLPTIVPEVEVPEYAVEISARVHRPGVESQPRSRGEKEAQSAGRCAASPDTIPVIQVPEHAVHVAPPGDALGPDLQPEQ